MPARKSGLVATVAATLFTGVAAPLLVNVAARALDADAHVARPAAQERARAAAPVEPPRTAQVLVEGEGRSEAEALRDALGNALRSAAAPQTDLSATDTASLLHDESRLILHWEEQHSESQRTPHGSMHRKQVAVTVDRLALADRLRAIAH